MMLNKLNEIIHLTRAFFILFSFIIYFILFFLEFVECYKQHYFSYNVKVESFEL